MVYHSEIFIETKVASLNVNFHCRILELVHFQFARNVFTKPVGMNTLSR